MVDYKKMYALLCVAVSDSLDILSERSDGEAIYLACFLLQQAMIRAEDVYIKTASDDNPAEQYI